MFEDRKVSHIQEHTGSKI